MQSTNVAFHRARVASLRLSSLRHDVESSSLISSQRMSSLTAALQIRESFLKAALSKAIALSKSTLLAKQDLEHARILSKEASDRALTLSQSAANLKIAARKVAAEESRTLVNSAEVFRKEQVFKLNDISSSAAADAAAKTAQRANDLRINESPRSCQQRSGQDEAS
jgi:hypothetical protein